MEIIINNNECSVCFNTITLEQLCITNCNHNFCKECLDKWFNIGKSSCPMCRTPIDYFKHLNKDTRVICVTKTINRPPLPNNNGNLIIQRRLYLILLTGSIWSLISSGLNIYLSISYSK